MRQSFSVAQILTAAQMSQLQDSVWSDDVNAQTGTSYTMVLTDAGKQVTMSNASASTLTVPPNSSVAFDVGTRIQVIQLGAGAVTLTQGAGVTVSSLATSLTMKQYQVAILIKTGTNTWVANLGASGGAVTSSASAPVSPAAGDLWFDTTTGSTFIYYNSAWVEVGAGAMSPYQATSTTRPSSPWTGQTTYETDTNRLLVWNGSAWVVPNSPATNPTGLELVTTVTCSSGGTASNGIITVGTTQSSVVVTNAFSSTYDNYRIMYSSGVANTTVYLAMTLGSASTAYFGSLFGTSYTASAYVGIGTNNSSSFPHTGLATTGYTMLDVDLYHPNQARSTLVSSKWGFNVAGSGYSMFAGEQASNTQFTGFTITPTGGTLTGGTIRVYGYRNS